ncbi:MAG: PEP/pyruvate-binding domain-containing protein, partial [Nitrospinota bacterium]
MARKFVYAFGEGKAEGSASMRELLGGKGSNLAEMASLGLPVPPGFTISTEACVKYLKDGQYPEGLWEEIVENVKRLEALMGATFGGEDAPLLFSVRSGARVSMPGMMDTVLNLGLNDKTVLGLARRTGNSRFAWDSYRRFVTMFGNVVMGLEHERFEKALEAAKQRRGAKADTDLTSHDLEALTQELKALVRQEKGEFPQEPYQQLRMAIDAVFRSWNTPRA